MKSDDDLSFTNYEFITKPHFESPKQNGVDLLVHNNYSYERIVSLENQHVDAIFAVCNLKSARILICSAYISPTTKSS